jgi:hypothetical protein
MVVPKEPRARSTRKKAAIGLTAIGSSGPWEIAIDQTVSGPDRWFAQIEGPSVYLRFEIPSLETIDQAISLLASHGKTGSNAAGVHDGTLAVGSNRSMRVSLLRDDEFSDRYFLVIEPKSGLVVRFTLAGDDLTHIVDALCQAKEDLES